MLDIKVTAGQTVSAGTVLLILEAMKMENEIVAPTAVYRNRRQHLKGRVGQFRRSAVGFGIMIHVPDLNTHWDVSLWQN